MFLCCTHLCSSEEYSQSGRPLIGHFAACSEVTSTLNEDLNLTALLHLFGAIAVWDYASAAPPVHIDMNPEVSSSHFIHGFVRRTINIF